MTTFDARRKCVSFAVLASVCSSPVDTQQMPAVDALVSQFFIGQAYPSGNVYLRPFLGDGQDASSWPPALTVVPIAALQNLPVRSARLERVLRNQVENDRVRSLYIPGEEGLDDSHDFCGLGEIKKRVESYTVMGPDFFDAIVDHCEPNDGVAVYRTGASTYSVMVLATAIPVSLKMRPVESTLRPLTDFERRQVEKEKQSGRNASDCSTDPAFLDQAVVLMEGQLSDSAIGLRLSSYINPGCAGHLVRIYILDFLQGGDLVRKLEIFQYKGAL